MLLYKFLGSSLANRSMILLWKKNKNKKETISRGFVEEAIIDLAYQMKDDSEGFVRTLESRVEKASDTIKVEFFFSNRSYTLQSFFLCSGTCIMVPFACLQYKNRQQGRRGKLPSKYWPCL